MVSGIGGMAALAAWLAALAALWRHCWRHGGIVGGIVAALAALLTFSSPVLHLSLCCPSGLVTRDARYAAELGAVRMPKARYGRLL